MGSQLERHLRRFSIYAFFLQLCLLPGLSQGQTLDSFNPGANGSIKTVAIQHDKKIIVGGTFTAIAGQPRNGIARLNPDGSIDNTFIPPSAIGSPVYTTAIQQDGKILIAGRLGYHIQNSTTNSLIYRLHQDGSLDTNYTMRASGRFPNIYTMVLQPDGKILVGGEFTGLGGQLRWALGRLNADGSLDTSFNPGTAGGQPYNTVNAFALQPDGKILVGGSFTSLAGVPRASIGRLNSNGTLDSTFNPGVYGWVYSMLVQPDGNILVGGYFNSLAGQSRNYLGRIDPNGNLDTSFNPQPWGTPTALTMQADGKILVGGTFTNMVSQRCNNLGRLNLDGSLNSSFGSGANDWVEVIALTLEKKILTGGGFTSLNDQPRSNIGQWINDSGSGDALLFQGSEITWVQTDSSPMLWHTAFEASTNGIDWFSLGSGIRISNGWQLSGVNLPTNATVIARGLPCASHAGWAYQLSAGGPAIRRHPLSQTNNAGGTTFFTVDALGSDLHVQWYRNDTALVATGHVSGVHTTTLQLTNISGADAALYWAVVSNAFGSRTSQVAQLSVIDPFISAHPTGKTNNAGTTATFSISAVGTALSYQWLKDGSPLSSGAGVSGANGTTLTLSNVTGANSGGYSIIVSGTYGMTTSLVAVLKVNDPYISTHPLSKSVHAGENVLLTVGAQGTSLNFQWRHDGTNVIGATASNLTLNSIPAHARGNYDVVVTSPYSSATSLVAKIAVNEATLVPEIFSANGPVHAIVPTFGGQIYVAGDFTTINGQSRSKLARLHRDGSVDSTFTNGANAKVTSLALQPDGKLLLAGDFTNLIGQARSRLGRLNPDGTLDDAFNPTVLGGAVTGTALQANGKILVWGSFTNLAGATKRYLGRLESNGSIDASFDPQINGTVFSAAIQSDGFVVIGGAFSQVNGQSRGNLARLQPSGALDSTFTLGANSTVYTVCLQPDGGILVGGDFFTLAGLNRQRIGRFNANGTLDVTFTSSVSSPAIYGMSLQADGSVIVSGGSFMQVNGESRPNIARLKSNGSLDTTFFPNPDSATYATALMKDGSVWVGGAFSTISGVTNSRFAKLRNSPPPAHSLSYSGGIITLQSDGAFPAFSRTSFFFSTNRTDWLALGEGIWNSGGWQLTNVVIPMNGIIRAQGHVTSSYYSASSWPLDLYLDLAHPVLRLGILPSEAGQFALHMEGPFATRAVVERSTDFSTWHPIFTNDFDNGPLELSQPLQEEKLFYRLRQVE